MAVDVQTLSDLEFDIVRDWAAGYAKQPTAHERLSSLAPISSFSEILYQLDKTNEFLKIRTEGETFPQLDFEELSDEIRLLPIKNASISLEGFMRIYSASGLVNRLLYFFDKRDEYPLLSGTLENVYYTKEIIEAIEKVFDKTGNVRDDASEALFEIRTKINSLKKQINKNFDRELRQLAKNNVLGDTRETFINDRRVLSILSSHKRKISGTVVGSSNTGSFTYIEPQVNVPLNNELEMLMDDERKEIFKILQVLRVEINEHHSLITQYQDVLTEFDFINAKTRLAMQLDCSRPKLSEDELKIELIDAYHPILWKNNKEQKKKTLPQQVQLDKFSRMLVISGPNAGGKSITLKSVGLIQIMLQAGLLVPVHENSVMCFFQNIMSDIGDNQSIANELSTYSYRLKRMKKFLDIANRKTLFLIDEFGTGSDPDLGGALAESIFESIYSKKSFGVITTHYANIKLKADKLRNAQNGCMLFNTETLAPLYKLDIGQPGSSFTFEVATINGIPQELIDDAKTKLDHKKVKMDQLLSDLQKEKTYLTRLNQEHIEAQETAQKALNDYTEQKKIYDKKIKDLRDNSVTNDKLLQSGKKMKAFIDRYNGKSRKKTINDPLLAEVKKYIAVEKSKIEEAKAAEKVKAKANSKKKTNKKKPAQDNFNRNKIVVGSKVKVISTKQSGTVEEISGNTIVVMFGFARMKVKLDKLQWIS